jgi:hypothetical protein
MKNIAGIAAALALCAASANAQDKLGTAAPEMPLRPGWILTPSFGFVETYDDNITLFGAADTRDNNDYVSSFSPHGALTYLGRHTRFTSGYGASFLNYRTFSLFNRWDQRGEAELQRQETAHLQWYLHANAAVVPSTEALEFNGIPFSHTGATMLDTRDGVEYRFDQRNSLSSALQYQHVTFDLKGTPEAQYLRGGWAASFINNYRHKLDERTSVGADYTFQRSQVRNDLAHTDNHTVEATLEYQVNSLWRFSGGAGVSMLTANPVTGAAKSPAFRGSIDRNDRGRRFHVGYMQGILPSFGLGGSVHTKEIELGYYTPLFHSRHFYTDHSGMFRDNVPVNLTTNPLRLRSLRTRSSFGWAPQPWVHVEGFYTFVAQSTLIPGGRLNRNRIGFQIVTSKPMRIE